MIPGDRLTILAARALQEAAESARRGGNPTVEDLHLIAALLDQEGGIVGPILRKVGVEPTVVARDVDDGISRYPITAS